MSPKKITSRVISLKQEVLGFTPATRFTLSNAHVPHPLDKPEAVAYLEAVEAQCSDDSDIYRRFLSLMGDWRGGKASIDEVIVNASMILKSRPALLYEFNTLLPKNYRIEFLINVNEVELITVMTPHGARIQRTSGAELASPPPHVTNIGRLRELLSTDHGMKELTSLKSDWASCVLQLLQTERDGEFIDEQYQRRCLRCLQQLAKKSGALPPSFLLRSIVREGKDAIRGGGFADIWKGHMNGQPVCLKVLRVFPEGCDKELLKSWKSFAHEALVWRQLHHPNILPFYGISDEAFAPRLCLVSPWMSNGHIMNFLEAHPDHDRLSSITEIAEGLCYLHELLPTIVHGDLKGTNVLVADDLRCCLADFGLVSVIESQNLETATSGFAHGTIRWMAPELLDSTLFPEWNAGMRTKADIYAFGCTMLEILTGKPPFSHHSRDVVVMYNVLQGVRPDRLSIDSDLSDDVWCLMDVCWTHQPNNRPAIRHVVQVLQNICNARDGDLTNGLPIPTLEILGDFKSSVFPPEDDGSDVSETSTPSTPLLCLPEIDRSDFNNHNLWSDILPWYSPPSPATISLIAPSYNFDSRIEEEETAPIQQQQQQLQLQHDPQTHLRDDFVIYFLRSDIGLPFLLDNKSIKPIMFEMAESNPGIFDAICLLSTIHQSRMSNRRYSQPENTIQARYALVTRILRKRVYLAEDAIVALLVVWSFLLNGGVGAWAEWLQVVYVFMDEMLSQQQATPARFLLSTHDPKLDFIFKIAIWFDVIASVTLCRPPHFLDAYRELFSPTGAIIDGLPTLMHPAPTMTSVMGCENHVVWAIAEASYLADWKAENLRKGCLSTHALIRRGIEIERHILPKEAPKETPAYLS